MNTLARLQAWCTQHCDSEWQHSSGITIRSCDNPGWWVKIDLFGTDLQTRSFNDIAEGVDEHRSVLESSWLSCYREGNVWHGAGDTSKLECIFDIFLAWAGEAGSPAA
jgi:Immunity protein 53